MGWRWGCGLASCVDDGVAVAVTVAVGVAVVVGVGGVGRGGAGQGGGRREVGTRCKGLDQGGGIGDAQAGHRIPAGSGRAGTVVRPGDDVAEYRGGRRAGGQPVQRGVQVAEAGKPGAGGG